jgi:sugar/nucleoside kinase (ribokinase family)
MVDVVCLGILVADVVAKPVEALPDRGRLLLVDQMELHTGGCAGNTGIGLSRLGVRASVIGKVGRDGFGDFYVARLCKEGLDAEGVVRDDVALTSATMVMVHGDGERSFLHYLGANATLTDADVVMDRLKGAKILHVAGALLMPSFDGEPTARVLKQAKAMGLTTALDTAWDGTGRWMKTMAPCLPYVDVAVPSIEEARMLTGRQEPEAVAQALVDHGIKTVALKMGEQGCYVRTAEGSWRLPAYRIDAVDATGAGDAFAAGFLAGVVKGWDPEKTGRFANAVGALCTLAIGTTAGLRGMEETLEFMNRTPTR